MLGLILLLIEVSENLASLRKNMGEHDIKAWDVDEQNCLKKQRVDGRVLLGLRKTQQNKNPFRPGTQRVEDKESRVSEPSEQVRDLTRSNETIDIVGVSKNLSDTPRKNTGREGKRSANIGEKVQNSPNHKDS
jgi:hypothetical protein